MCNTLSSEKSVQFQINSECYHTDTNNDKKDWYNKKCSELAQAILVSLQFIEAAALSNRLEWIRLPDKIVFT
jgi:hypothetical protein